MDYYVRSGSLQGYFELVQSFGADPVHFLNRAQLLPANIRDPDSMIPYHHLGDILEDSARELNTPYFGFRLAAIQGLSTIGLIGAHMAQKDTIGQALEVAQKFSHMHAQGSMLKIVEINKDQCELLFDVMVNANRQYPQLVQLSIGLIYKLIHDMIGHVWQDVKINCRQSLPEAEQRAVMELIHCEVEFGTTRDSIIFSKSVLGLRPYKDVGLVRDIIDKQFSQQQARPHDEFMLVRHAINSLLPTGDCSKENVAQSLGMHPKKLERVLATRNFSYRDVLEDTRKSIALNTLKAENISLSRLALNLGYSEFSAFSRSFKRWFGVSPTRFRKDQKAMI
ncbi:AraC family transcriptional regulator [Thalassotalea mangrovi]|uniref:AraC family transcriptional regulator n=1 Tax=Thalassotalea mangrovi TaxID=2572245 RepID=A0A4U1B8I1_9GAMM|nr:AraC family transcriptional regulator [Thalassotalea mangrovi]TKB46325.1 AraC family transcriptional regulator [Thalassotalea mangrovi]